MFKNLTVIIISYFRSLLELKITCKRLWYKLCLTKPEHRENITVQNRTRESNASHKI
jgi:hypothetical protein